MATLYDLLQAHKNKQDEKRVFGLVLQGGGMRAAYVAGALTPLVEYGFNDTFDHVVGASAGAINGAYFIAGEREMAKTYTDSLTNKNFVNLGRREKRVDIDYLVDVVLKHKRPIDAEKLLHAHSNLHIVVTKASSGRKKVISDHNKFMDIYEEFRATAALPLLYDRLVKIGSKWYVDGGIADLLPIDVAHKLGCTDIVVIMSRSTQSYVLERSHDQLINRLVRYFSKQPAAVRRELPTNQHMFQTNLHTLRHPFKDTRIYVLEPSNDHAMVSQVTIEKDRVRAWARLGVTDMDEFLRRPLDIL